MRRYDSIGRWAGGEVFAGIRWGGDELLLVIPGRDAEAAREELEQLMTSLAGASLVVEGLDALTPTLAIGLAGSSSGERPDVEAMLAAAAAALEDARAAGGDRVVERERPPAAA